jgi:hypothetical protein
MPPSIATAQCLLNNYLVGWWSANEDSEDHSGLNNDGVMNGTELGHGVSWWGFCFDGVDDDVTVPHHANQNLGAGFTVDAWVNTNAYGHGWPIAQKRSAGNVGGFTLETTHAPFGNNFGLQFVIWIAGAAKTVTTPANVMTNFVWHHVAATYDGAFMKIYVDAVEQASLSAPGSIDASTAPLVMGRNVVNTAFAMNGCIDEVHLFNRALTQAEIQWIRDADFWGICPTPVGPTDAHTALGQNYPNPFNPSTVIDYELSEALDVNLTVYDASGRQVRSLVRDRKPAGPNSVRWDGKDDSGRGVATGVYFYRLQAGGVSQTRKMVLLK